MNLDADCRQNWQSLAYALAQNYELAWVTAKLPPAPLDKASKRGFGANSTLQRINDLPTLSVPF